jgi:hypothetical protein
MPFAGIAGPAWMPASTISWVCEANPEVKNGMDAMCRRSRTGMDAGVNRFPGFCFAKPKAQNRHGAQ